MFTVFMHAVVVICGLLLPLSYLTTRSLFLCAGVYCSDPWLNVFVGCFLVLWLVLDNLSLAVDLRSSRHGRLDVVLSLLLFLRKRRRGEGSVVARVRWLLLVEKAKLGWGANPMRNRWKPLKSSCSMRW